MRRRKSGRDFPRLMPLLWWIVLVVVSAGHLAIGFSSLNAMNSCRTSIGRSRIAGRVSSWGAVNTDGGSLASTVARAKKAAEPDVGADATTAVSSRRTANFEKRFQDLLEFKEIHGHTRVPRRHKKLGEWVNKLRQRKERLDEQRLKRLNEIGFCWDASDDKGGRKKSREKWWEKLESIRKIQQENLLGMAEAGSENVAPVAAPSSRVQSPAIPFDKLTISQQNWLGKQRVQYIGSGRKPSAKLDELQIQALNEIDPKWWQTARERKWDVQYAALIAFKRKHGHCNVKSTYKDKKLANWVQNTRKKYRAVKLQSEDALRSDGSLKLSKRQILLLDKIDFIWDPWGHHADSLWLTNTSDNKSRSSWD